MARNEGDTSEEINALLGLSASRIVLFDYQGALRAAGESRTLAFKTGDKDAAGSAYANLATIYSQLGDFSLAAKSAARAAELLKTTRNRERLVKALLILANADAERARVQIEAARSDGDGEAERKELDSVQRDYRRGVAVAHAARLLRLEANLWEELGYSLLLAHHPEAAEEPLRRAYALELSAHNYDDLAVNKAHQAELQLQKHNYGEALDLISQAFTSGSIPFKSLPQFYPLHIRGLLLLRLNRESEALTELRRAVDAANAWRQGALPGDATSTRTVVVLNDVYHDYAQLAATISLRTRNTGLAREGLEVLAENRAANLREQITFALLQKQRLPRRYFDLLAELQAAQARVTLGENRPEDKAKLEQVRLEVGLVENEYGLNFRGSSQPGEKFSHKNSLKDIQATLSRKEVLLSFSLGEGQSFLWAVTCDQVSVYRLSGEKEIGILATQFSHAVQRLQDTNAPGRNLSQALFGSLPAAIWSKPDWLVVGDGVLLDGVPFASLPDLTPGSPGRCLTHVHNIRFLPSELLLVSTDKVKAQRLFVGIGDPIYNFADSRRTASGPGHLDPNRASMALPRLAGSEHEVRTAARESGLARSQFLIGREATIGEIQKAVAKFPEIIHFAVHVVSPEGAETSSPSSQAALALSLTKDNIPELLTPEAIATLRVPGSLVILSGCSSLKGEILPSAGLMGLSRAWLLAGASAVVVSAWPTPDDSGRFFSSFYSHFDADPSGSLSERAALALQQSQIEMEHGGGYRSAPKFWAAYSIISKE